MGHSACGQLLVFPEEALFLLETVCVKRCVCSSFGMFPTPFDMPRLLLPYLFIQPIGRTCLPRSSRSKTLSDGILRGRTPSTPSAPKSTTSGFFLSTGSPRTPLGRPSNDNTTGQLQHTPTLRETKSLV